MEKYILLWYSRIILNNVLNQIKKIENNLKFSINTERNLRETSAIAAIKNNAKYFYKFVKNN